MTIEAHTKLRQTLLWESGGRIAPHADIEGVAFHLRQLRRDRIRRCVARRALQAGGQADTDKPQDGSRAPVKAVWPRKIFPGVTTFPSTFPVINLNCLLFTPPKTEGLAFVVGSAPIGLVSVSKLVLPGKALSRVTPTSSL